MRTSVIDFAVIVEYRPGHPVVYVIGDGSEESAKAFVAEATDYYGPRMHSAKIVTCCTIPEPEVNFGPDDAI